MTSRPKALPLTEPEKLWREIARFGDAEFTMRDLLGRYGALKPDSLRKALLRLARRGLVRPVGLRAASGAIHPTKVYVCAHPKAPMIPGARADSAAGQRQHSLWRAMRTFSGWSIVELAVAASTEDVPVSVACASTYVSSLVKAGVVQVLKRRGSSIGTGSIAATYRLAPAANSGPAAPQVRRGRRVYDVNRRRWLGETSENEVSA